ncbi:Putative uncharacterized protein [Bacillus mycoides]|nr:Putative uncharacterized protein [Bacillus mycoides]
MLLDEFIFRTEDIDSREIEDIFVATKTDLDNLSYLKSKSPILLEGSRGTGKTMLLRMAERELDANFNKNRELPVYVNFSKAIFVDAKENSLFFRNWMYSKILFALKRKLEKKGLLLPTTSILEKYFGAEDEKKPLTQKLDEFIFSLENSWSTTDFNLTKEAERIFGMDLMKLNVIRDVDYFKALIEDICDSCNIKRVILLFDEACHNFIPIQQREFFTLFRDLRCSFISCKAAVYPGITSYGTFQAFHDAVVRKVERDINSKDYVEKMREIVKNQVDESTYKIFENNGENFNALVYAASGNPRMLLKSLFLASEDLKNLKATNVNSTIKNFYRTNIWSEHTKLSNIYEGHKELIDWGRWFVENKVLMETINKNEKRLIDDEDNKYKQTIFFAIQKDAPAVVKQSIKILEYSGIISLHTEGTKVKSEIYDRYQINFGVVLASEPKNSPVQRFKEIINNLSVKIFTEYGSNSPSYEGIEKISIVNSPTDAKDVLKNVLADSIEKLDLTNFQCQKLKDAGFNSLEDILSSTEKELTKAERIGPIKARRIYNIAFNAAMEYISG